MSNMRLLATLATALFLMTTVSGCLEIQTGDGEQQSRSVRRTGSPEVYAAPAAGDMTGDEVGDQTTTAACNNGGGGVQIPPQGTVCAKRIITIEGTMGGLKDLPVELTTFAGGIDVVGGQDNAWTLVATLGARGQTDEEARRNLDNIEFTWSHVKDKGHFLEVEAKKVVAQTNNQESALLHLTIPSSLELFLTAQTQSGGIDASDLKLSQGRLLTQSGGIDVNQIDAIWLYLATQSGGIDALDVTAEELDAMTQSGGVSLSGAADVVRASTQSGGIDADLIAINVDLVGQSGGISAKLTPKSTGTFSLSTGSGGVDLEVPEESQYGYSIDATAMSGGSDIDLEDGSTTGKEGTKHFVTKGFSGRSIRTEVTAQAMSGSIMVSPA